jgi:hypothetical protein
MYRVESRARLEDMKLEGNVMITIVFEPNLHEGGIREMEFVRNIRGSCNDSSRFVRLATVGLLMKYQARMLVGSWWVAP